MGVLTFSFSEMSSLFVFTFFANIKTFYGSVIAHYARVNKTFGSQMLIFFQNRIRFSFSFHILNFFVFQLGRHHILGNIRVHHSNSRELGKR